MPANHYFISYSREQLHFAESLSLNLSKRGIPIWLDLEQLEPGGDWSWEIGVALDNCAGLILVASRSALASPYVRDEWQRAIRAGKQIYVIAYEPVALPAELRGAVVVDGRGWFRRAVKRLTRSIQTGEMVRDHVPPPNRFNLPRKVPPGIFLGAMALVLGALLVPLAAILSPIQPKLLAGGVGLIISGFLLWSWWRLLHHRLSYAWIAALLLLPFVLIGLFWMRSAAMSQADDSFFAQWFIYIVLVGVAGFVARKLFGPDLVRWLPPGDEQTQDLRRAVHRSRQGRRGAGPVEAATSYTLHHAPADRPIARSIRKAMRKANVPEAKAGGDYRIVILTERTLGDRLSSVLAGSTPLIAVLAANLQSEGDDLLAEVLERQVIEYRDRSDKRLAVLAEYLWDPAAPVVARSQEILPQPFTKFVVPTSTKAYASALRLAGAYATVAGVTALVLALLGERGLDALELAGLGGGLVFLWMAQALVERRVHKALALLCSVASAVLLIIAFFLPFAATWDGLASFDGRPNMFISEIPWAVSQVFGIAFIAGFMALATAYQFWRSQRDWLPALTLRRPAGQTLRRRPDGARLRKALLSLLIGLLFFFVYPTAMLWWQRTFLAIVFPQLPVP